MPRHAAPLWLPVSPAAAGVAPGLTRLRRRLGLSLRPRASMFGRVDVPVVDGAARGAGPRTGRSAAWVRRWLPQAEHTWTVGSNRPIRAKVRPYRAALYSSMATNGGPAGVMDRLGQPGTAEPGHAQVLHIHRLVLANDPCESLVAEVGPPGRRPWRARGRPSPAPSPCSCCPCCLRESARCNRLSFFSARRRNRGARDFVPSDSTANAVSPGRCRPPGQTPGSAAHQRPGRSGPRTTRSTGPPRP